MHTPLQLLQNHNRALSPKHPENNIGHGKNYVLCRKNYIRHNLNYIRPFFGVMQLVEKQIGISADFAEIHFEICAAFIIFEHDKINQ